MTDSQSQPELRILAIVTGGEYGNRHLANVRDQGPPGWQVEHWLAPRMLPPVVDDPDEFVPQSLGPADLIVSFAEHAAVAQLIPEVARVTGAGAVIAGIDNEAWLPRGLARQLHEWLTAIDVTCVTPKPWCSLTETDYMVRRGQVEAYDHPTVAAFARVFGKPDVRITVEDGAVAAVEIARDSVCGSARFVADGLVGSSVGDAEEEAGLLHHHFPCLASMDKDSDFNDTLMHVSGNIMRDLVAEQIRPHNPTRYLRP